MVVNGKAKRNNKFKLDNGEIGVGKVSENEVKDNEFGKNNQKISKSKKLCKSKKMVGSLAFFTFRAKLIFIKLK